MELANFYQMTEDNPKLTENTFFQQHWLEVIWFPVMHNK
jgi:hypothetical protein